MSKLYTGSAGDGESEHGHVGEGGGLCSFARSPSPFSVFLPCLASAMLTVVNEGIVSGFEVICMRMLAWSPDPVKDAKKAGTIILWEGGAGSALIILSATDQKQPAEEGVYLADWFRSITEQSQSRSCRQEPGGRD